jgi:hypothetical protein
VFDLEAIETLGRRPKRTNPAAPDIHAIVFDDHEGTGGGDEVGYGRNAHAIGSITRGEGGCAALEIFVEKLARRLFGDERSTKPDHTASLGGWLSPTLDTLGG